MATTTNGIYYPNDYDSVADIPADMKKIAESVDTKIAENKTEINNIKTEQTTQNANISSLEKDNTTNKQDITNIKAKDTEQDKYIAELEAENARLREDLNGLPKGQASGESIDLSDSAEMRCELKISGNSVQDGEPIPDEPVEVESCGDNINLFDKNDITNNTSINVRNGNTYTDNNSFSTNFIKINGITELCCNGLSDTSKLWGAIYDENKSFIKGINTTNGIFNETNLSGATYIRLGLLKTYLDTMKLEKGSTPSPFSPYGQGCINEVICNKNLFDKKKILTGYYLDKSGNVIQDGTWNCSDYIKVLPNTIFIVSANNNMGNNPAICFYDKNKKFISGSNYGSEVVKKYTTPSNCYYIRLSVSNPLLNSFQLEEGSTVTPYQECQSQSYTIPTQREMLEGDYFDWDNEEEVHTWNKLVLNGTENIGKLTNDNYNRFYLKLPSTGIYGQAICNYYKVENSKNKGQCDIDRSGTNVLFHSPSDSITTVEQCKNWIKLQYNTGTPVTIYYKTATETRLAFTEEQKAVAKKLNNAKTYKNVTHIYSTDEISPVIDVTYKKDIETLFANTLVEGV